MKQKYADCPNWGRILEKRYFQEYISDDNYEGYISYLFLDKVKDPLTVMYDMDEVRIVDDGYSWLMFFPLNKSYSLTVMINQEYEVLQWYFDIIKSIELTTKGIPYINDMYLDYIVLPNGILIIKDEDELESAHDERLITDEDYNHALLEGERLRNSIVEKTNELLNHTYEYVVRLKKYREGKIEDSANF